MNKEFDGYRETMESLQFSPEAKKRMTNTLAEAAKAQPQKTPVRATRGGRRPWRIFAAAAAAAALVVAIGGGAYASGALMSVTNVLDDVFGGAPAQTEVVDKIGRPIGASATSNDVTITAEAIIGDKANYVIVYSIAKQDGTAFDLPEPLDNGVLPLVFTGETSSHVDGENSGGGSAYFYDADPKDNAFQYVEEKSVEMGGTSLIGKTARVHLEDLMLQDGDKSYLFAEGSWDFKFAINYEDTSVSLPAGQTFDLNGMNATVDSVDISPIAVTLNYTIDAPFALLEEESGRMSERAERELDRFNPSIALNLKDGTILDVSNGSWGAQPSDSETVCYKNVVLPQFVNLDDVASVTIGATTVPMP